MLMLLHTFGGGAVDPPGSSSSGFAGWEMAVLACCLVLLILQGAGRG
jgi:hypothetical protein